MSSESKCHAKYTTLQTPAWWEGSCIKCGYSLRGLDSPICPECGSTARYFKVEHGWGIGVHLLMAIIGICYGYFSMFLGFDGPGIVFALFVVLPLGVRQRFSLLRLLLSVIASIAGYSVASRIIHPEDPFINGMFGLFLSFTVMGIAGMVFLCLILFWNHWKQFIIAIFISAIASNLFVVLLSIESDYNLAISFGLWQSILAFTLSWLLNYKIVPVDSDA